MTSSGRRHRVLFALALVAACGQPSPGFAKEAWKGCFGRVYDAAHLAAHPGQTVTSIAVLMTPMTARYDPFIANAQLTVTPRGKKTKYYASGDCTANAAGLDCALDCDAGSFTLARRAAGVKLVNISKLALCRADQDCEDRDEPFVLTNNSEGRTFLLPPAPAAACK